jgi:adenylylsulfate kinase-like enzyme
LVGPDRFVEVLIDAPEAVTAARKAARTRRPSLSKRAKRAIGRVARVAFRGREAYEVPVAPDVLIDTTVGTPTQGAQAILDLLVERGFLVAPGPPVDGAGSELVSAP